MSEWRKVTAQVKALHMVGRTVAGIQPSVTLSEIAAMEETIGTVRMFDAPALSKSQRLDLIATHIIRQDAALRPYQQQSEILTLWSAKMRADREIPFEDMDRSRDDVFEMARDFIEHRRWWGYSLLVGGNHPRSRTAA